MKKIFLITTGGSGGHVIPATILYEHLSNEADVIISTDKRGLQYLDKAKYKFEVIDTPKIDNIFFFTNKSCKNSIFNFKIIFFIKKSKS